MKKRTGKVLSVLLSASMIFGMIQPITALAKEEQARQKENIGEEMETEDQSLRLWYTSPGTAETWKNTQFLPALPSAWPNGSVEGIKSRGNFTIGETWKEGKAKNFTVCYEGPEGSSTFTGNYEGIADAAVLENGKKIETVIDAENHRLSFEAEKGKVYTIDLSGEAITDPEQPEQKPGGGTEGETEGSGDANKPENKPDNKPDKKPEIHHGKEQIGTPKTGDEVGIALPISMMFAIAAGSCVILIAKKKRNKNM